MKNFKIKSIYGLQVMDSRGNPTVEVNICSESGEHARAMVPSGASTGEKEAIELRDGGSDYMGLGVSKAIKNINEIIAPKLIAQGYCITEQKLIDEFMIKLDGTPNKAKLGANAILGISLAVARLGAKLTKQPLYKYLGGTDAHIMPVPMLNIINGGAHAANDIDFQEFMIMPVGAKSICEAIKMASEVYHNLKKILSENKYSTLIGDEGGFAPDCKSIDEVLNLLVKAIKKAGYNPARKGDKAIAIAMDSACSELWDGKKYVFKKLNAKLPEKDWIFKSTNEMIDLFVNLVEKYPIISIEDPLDENDWDGFEKLTSLIGDKVQIVGDDIFVTNPKLVKKGIENKTANSVLIKVNQIGSLTETIDAIQLAQKNNWTTIVSHRSGETEDTTIADLAVAFNTGQIKTGSMARTDRVAKYNQLLRIEKCLGEKSKFLGPDAFYNVKIGK